MMTKKELERWREFNNEENILDTSGVNKFNTLYINLDKEVENIVFIYKGKQYELDIQKAIDLLAKEIK